jgi:ribosomal protein S18 acetylase RimI-like enzyme
MSSIEIGRLGARTSKRARSELDRVLTESRRALVRSRQHLAPIDERIDDAQGDLTRVILYARIGDRAVGIIDASLHTPSPGDLTVAQIAVKEEHRRGLVASSLLFAALENEEIVRVSAGVHRDNYEAQAFFERLGMAVVEEWKDGVLFAAPVEVVQASLRSLL